MRFKVCLAVALLVAFGVMAEDPPKADPMMEAMMKAATPGDPHKKLNEFAGTWNTTITLWPAPGAPPMSSTGTSENKWVLGGRYLEQRFAGSFAGMPMEGIGYSGYDNVKQQYWGTWVDNMSTGMMVTTGKTADGKVWNFSGTFPDPMTGKDAPVEEKITIVDKNKHVFEMWGPGPDGKMYKTMEIVYTRK